jgi:hypothetical protein
MSGIKFVHVPVDKYYEFIKGATESEDIVECATYVNMKENKIYFVERPKHGGMFELIHDEMPNWRGQRNNLKVLDDYAGDAILDDSCKVISSMGLS